MKRTWIWCLSNTILIILLAIGIGCLSMSIDSLEDQIKQDKHQIEMLQSQVDILKQRDTISVNINVPNDISIIYKCQ